MDERLAPGHAAPQHGRAPRPLPLFLELVRMVGEENPTLARQALEGLSRYEYVVRGEQQPLRPVAATAGGAMLRDHGGAGTPVVLVPSLINPPHVLDLPGHSLTAALALHHRVLLLDWGAARERGDLDLGAHVAELLVPLLRSLGEPVSLVGYCLGGTMALAAANLIAVNRVATLAAPWRFAAYPPDAIAALARLWRQSAPAAERFGALPTEILQAAFWSLDPRGIVVKFARLAGEPKNSAAVARFVTLEDWANEGEPVPLPAARELIERLFARDCTGKGEWRVAGTRIRADAVPALHFTARGDRIVPTGSAAPGPSRAVGAGHVGMIVGRRAADELHKPLLAFLAD
ncbi:MAG: alpha/beta fold hydrolase [Sphingomicrobium sp.]|nr:alpha/beta fold hydrolase [Sphingomonadales bacterium]